MVKEPFYEITIDTQEPDKIPNYFYKFAPKFLGEYNYDIKIKRLKVGDIQVIVKNPKFVLDREAISASEAIKEKIIRLANELINVDESKITRRIVIERKNIFDFLASLYSNHLGNQLIGTLEEKEEENEILYKYLLISGEWHKVVQSLKKKGRMDHRWAVKQQILRSIVNWDSMGIRVQWVPTDEDLVVYALMTATYDFVKMTQYKIIVDPVDKKLEPMVKAIVSMVPGVNTKTAIPIAKVYPHPKTLTDSGVTDVELSNIVRIANGRKEQKHPLQNVTKILKYFNDGDYDE